jgi:hypothetical protein
MVEGWLTASQAADLRSTCKAAQSCRADRKLVIDQPANLTATEDGHARRIYWTDEC